MVWFKVDDKFHSHPKALSCSLAALGLWAVAGSWSSDHPNDGFVSDDVVRSLSRGEPALADALVAAGLWRRAKGGYRFHEWDADGDGSVRNPTRSEVMAAKANQSSGGAIGNHRRWHVQRGVTDANCRFCQQKPSSGTRSGTRSVPDDETESDPNPPSPIPSGDKDSLRSSSARKRGTTIPVDFEATPEMIAWAREHTPLVGRAETDRFVDYWRAIPGARGRKLDWVATWRNWMRKAQDDAIARQRPADRRQNADDTIRSLLLPTGSDDGSNGAVILHLPTGGQP